MKNNFIESYSINKKICKDLITLFEEIPEFHKDGAVGLGEVKPEIKKSKEVSFKPYSPHIEEYLKELSKCVNKYKSKYDSLNDLTRWAIVENVKIQKYKPKEGYFRIHCERDAIHPYCDRLLVFMTYLNTIKEKGGTEFPYQNYTAKPIEGNTLIWPADYTHPHKGVIAPKETKYIITGWYGFLDT